MLDKRTITLQAYMFTPTVVVRIAQWIARRTSNPEVVGSNPTVDDVFFSPCVTSVCFLMKKYCLFVSTFLLVEITNVNYMTLFFPIP